MLGCVDSPEYGTILDALPVLKDAEAPFPFPMEGDDDHQNCHEKFAHDMDFM
jgi:hypothetical protein